MKRVMALCAAILLAIISSACESFSVIPDDYDIKATDGNYTVTASKKDGMDGDFYTFRLYQKGEEVKPEVTFYANAEEYFNLEWHWQNQEESLKAVITVDGTTAELYGGEWKLTIDFETGAVTSERVFSEEEYTPVVQSDDGTYSVGIYPVGRETCFLVKDNQTGQLTYLFYGDVFCNLFLDQKGFVYYVSYYGITARDIATQTWDEALSNSLPDPKPYITGAAYDSATGYLLVLGQPNAFDKQSPLTLYVINEDRKCIKTIPTNFTEPLDKPFTRSWPYMNAQDGELMLSVEGEVIYQMTY